MVIKLSHHIRLSFHRQMKTRVNRVWNRIGSSDCHSQTFSHAGIGTPHGLIRPMKRLSAGKLKIHSPNAWTINLYAKSLHRWLLPKLCWCACFIEQNLDLSLLSDYLMVSGAVFAKPSASHLNPYLLICNFRNKNIFERKKYPNDVEIALTHCMTVLLYHFIIN